jgi:hypothetical protein
MWNILRDYKGSFFLWDYAGWISLTDDAEENILRDDPDILRAD